MVVGDVAPRRCDRRRDGRRRAAGVRARARRRLVVDACVVARSAGSRSSCAITKSACRAKVSRCAPTGSGESCSARRRSSTGPTGSRRSVCDSTIAADSLHGEIGERMPVGLDIEWEADPASGIPHEYRPDDRSGGYEQFGAVHGEVLLDRARLEIDAIGLRSHTWGPLRVDRPAFSAWVHSNERSLSFTGSDESHVDGYVVLPGGPAKAISSVRRETGLRADGLPDSAHFLVDDIEIDARGARVVGRAVARTRWRTGDARTRSLCLRPRRRRNWVVELAAARLTMVHARTTGCDLHD